jgi:hypothetical protein
MSRLAIDFDGTIHDPTNVLKGYKMGQPMLAAAEALTRLKQEGHEIIIFPTWADRYDRRKAILDWLTYFKIPFDDITSVKPEADLYIDNNAVRFESWGQTIDFIDKLSLQ